MNEITVKVSRRSGRKYLFAYYDDPITGKRVEKSTKCTRQREAEKFAARWEAELRSGKFRRDTKITWEAFRQRYERERLASLSPKTAVSFCSAANHLERILCPKLLGGITTSAMSQFQAALREEKMIDATIDCHLRHLAPAFAWAVKMGLLAHAPEIERPRSIKGKSMMRGRPLTDVEFKRLIEAVKKVRPDDATLWEYYLRGLWLSGLRLEESTKVSWDSNAEFAIDLTSKYPRFRIYAEAHKGRRDQYLPMTPDFAEFLLATPEEQRTGPLFQAAQLYGVKRLTKIISRIGRRASIVVEASKEQFATAHDLRRSFGTRWASRVKPATLQMLMRHKSIETTLKHYVSQDADDIAAGLWESLALPLAVSEQTDTSSKKEDKSEPAQAVDAK